ncbi:vWA domain-containing protein [Nakamurella leprariae]|uniref:VWA domain-containing protein n=1 Tax=Nakamurella leprariae TaxID=2803911 RepID=A0A938YCL7_9ACTN|nr:VWA domain-containing protein [Nakamurella leprariae]MBM9466012.1 VWA domain-containing protein [Nakamurella leprariae]
MTIDDSERPATELGRGANTTLTASAITVLVGGAEPGAVDLMAFQLGGDRTVRSDADFVFFNQPRSPEGALEVRGGAELAIDLTAVPAAIETIAVTVALDASRSGALADIPALGVTIVPTDGSGALLAPAAGLTTERAAVLVEIYRRADAWKVRCVSAGWAEGLAALVREHGVTVDDEPAPVTPTASAAPAPAVPAPAAPPAPPVEDGPRSVPGEERLSLVKRQALDLRKREVHRVLLTKGVAGERARTILVIDKTGSMYDEYASRLVHRVVERMVPVATQLDDDGSFEVYLYAKSFARLPDLTVADLETWPDEYLHISGKHGGIDYKKIGGINDEIPIITEVMGEASPDRSPTLVLFFTDGGFHKRREITALMKRAADLPIFWVFVGLGANDYGLLTKLDDMGGRTVDNVDFFAVDDIDRVDDAELYRRLLGEYPEWLRAARATGIVAPTG